MADDLEQGLSKIRPHTSSSLAHQKAPATLLKALEATFNEQSAERTPTAYFAALLTTLDGSLQTAQTSGPTLGDGDILPAELYILALVMPFVPHPVVRANLDTLISLTAPLFPALVPHAPPLRSQLTIYASLFGALDKPQLEAHGLRQAFASILHLCLDPRPKVRKKAAELVKDVLSQPPPPTLRHPYADRVAEWAVNALSELAGGVPKFKGKKVDTDGSGTAIHLIAFLRPVLSFLPSSVSAPCADYPMLLFTNVPMVSICHRSQRRCLAFLAWATLTSRNLRTQCWLSLYRFLPTTRRTMCSLNCPRYSTP